MTTRRSAALGTGLAFALLACAGGSETGNPVETQLALGLRSEDPELIGVRSGAGGAVLEHAWLAIGETTLLASGQCANLGEIDIFGPTRIASDLARDDAPIELGQRSDRYCGLALPLNLSSDDLPDDAPAELADHSVVLRGARADGTAFELLHSEQDTIELAAAGDPFTVAAEGPRLLLSFDVAVWMRGVDLDAATVGDDGVIHIDVNTNRSLLDTYEANLECSLTLYADADADGEVSSGDPLLARCAPD